MSDEGEKVCPLCTEEMDLTDQQLRPCRCGYQVCVWCWHHIMEMAEKDNTEGRCPACRTPYDKEKIVGTAANCERLVAEISSERKIKSNKAKSKTDGRMRLSTVRVIQRNLVYIIGIPSNLADEDALQHKEYFGKYGKVLKVSISRTAGGAIQHSSNNTCSVYITYSKEEEAVRCIQSVHGYTLDGKPLRACFGTTKYCHAWLRNMSCSNPDCLYLHEIGTEEDSFSQDKIISAYTRSRAQQMTATSNNLDRRSGSMLPPPFDDFCIDDTESLEKPVPRSVPNISAPQPQIKTSPPNSSSGRSPVLPAAASWGLRAFSSRHPATSSSSSDGLVNQKPDGSFSSIVASSTQTSTLHNDAGKRPVVNEESQALRLNDRVKPLESSKQNTFRDSKATEPDRNAKVMCIAAPASASSDNHISSRPTSRHSEMVVTTPPVENLEFSGNEMGIKMPPEGTSPCRTASDAEDENVAVNGTVDNLCSGLASIGLGNHLDAETGDAHVLSDKVPTQQSFRSHKDQGMQQYHLEDISDHPSLVPSRKFITPDGVSFSTEQTGWSTELSSSQVIPEVRNQVKEETSAFDEQSLKFPEPTHPLYSFNSSNSFKASNHYSGHPFQLGDMCSTSNLGNTVTGTVQTKVDEMLPPFEYRNFLGSSVLNLNKVVNSPELTNSFDYSNFPSNMDDRKYRGRLNNAVVGGGGGNGAADMGESSIISNILSMDDVWSDSLTSSRNLAQLFSDTDRQNNSVKAQNNNESRFSFARQEDVGYQRSSVEPSFGNIGSMANLHSSFQGLPENRDPYLDRHRNGFSSNFPGEPESFLSSQFSLPSDRLSAARGQISAPPGFSHPIRPAPPGFSSHERLDQTFDTLSGHHLFENSSMLRNQYPPQPTNSIDDPEFIDPAILFVGKGRRPNGMNSLSRGLDMRSTFNSQRSVSPEDFRLQQLLMQQSISTHQNLRYPDHIGDRFSPVTDAYNRTPSRFPEQSQITNPLLFSQSSFHQSRNGHYDGWNEVQNGNSNDFAMAELLRNERLGGGFYKQHYPSYEDLKYRMPNSGDIYNNRAFGM